VYVCALTNHQGFDFASRVGEVFLSSAGTWRGELWLSAQIVVLHCLKVLVLLGLGQVSCSGSGGNEHATAPAQARYQHDFQCRGRVTYLLGFIKGCVWYFELNTKLMSGCAITMQCSRSSTAGLASLCRVEWGVLWSASLRNRFSVAGAGPSVWIVLRLCDVRLLAVLMYQAYNNLRVPIPFLWRTGGANKGQLLVAR
jgi:hypothetical protein